MLILRDLSPAGGEAMDPAARLASLERLLDRAQSRRLSLDWRADLAARSGAADLLHGSPAQLAAGAWLAAPTPGAQHWFATPVHLLAGLDTLRLHPAGLLQLPGAVQTALAQDFDALFAGTPWRLHAIGRRELLLSGPMLAASAADPALLIGRSIGEGMAQGTAGGSLRRLGVEIEMWLHQHPINRDRERHGELPVSALWLWGALPWGDPGSSSRAAPLAIATSALFGEDIWAEAVWNLRGGGSAALPACYPCRDAAAGGSDIVLYPSAGSAEPVAMLRELERAWIAPALRALRAGELGEIELLVGQRSFRLRRAHLARFWRASAPWWERLA